MASQLPRVVARPLARVGPSARLALILVVGALPVAPLGAQQGSPAPADSAHGVPDSTRRAATRRAQALDP
ncbi:MAG: hypothetical protein ACJ79S_15825, partial [Gemmatimonadaceae bacterium]